MNASPNNNNVGTGAAPEWVRVPEALKRTGMSHSYLYELIASGEVRYVRLLARPGKKPLAYHPGTRELVEPPELKFGGQMIDEPPGPLGPRPLTANSQMLIQCWLPEEEWGRWWQAGRFRAGTKAVIERIEREILELEARPDFEHLLIDPRLMDDDLPACDLYEEEQLEVVAEEPCPPEETAPSRAGSYDPELEERRRKASWRAIIKAAIPCTFEEPEEEEDGDPDEPDTHRVAVGRPPTYWDWEVRRPRGALPDFEDGEVEIVSIRLNSTMGDLISVRACPDGDMIRYRVVDEYDELDADGKVMTRYSCRPAESSLPLTLNEVKRLLWSVSCDGSGQIFKTAWEEQLDGPIEDYQNDFYYLLSDFYDGLQAWLLKRFEQWKSQDD